MGPCRRGPELNPAGLASTVRAERKSQGEYKCSKYRNNICRRTYRSSPPNLGDSVLASRVDLFLLVHRRTPSNPNSLSFLEDQRFWGLAGQIQIRQERSDSTRART